MMSHEPLLLLNAAICTITAARLMTFRRNGCRHRLWGGFLAWLLIFISLSIPLRVLMGDYLHVDWAEVVLNTIVMLSALRARGNVVKILS